MKPTLQLRLTQHLTLTPQLQQSIRLLQLSTLELNQEIERMLLENPVLEREEVDTEPTRGAPDAQGERAGVDAPGGDAPEASGAQEAMPEWGTETGGAWRGDEDEDADRDRSLNTPEQPSLRDHLNAQLTLTALAERDRVLVGILIDALNDDGYLAQPLEEILALLPPDAGVDAEELAIALRQLQNLDPCGVGARSPAECLALQLRAQADGDPVRDLALTIVEQHIGLLANRDYVRLKAVTGADDDALRAAQQRVRSLNPRPGAEFARIEARYVVPDVLVRKVRNVWRASLNTEAMPRLRVHRMFADLAARSRGGHALSVQFQEARWLIKNIQQRFDTILRVSQEIIDRQRQFFEHGDVAMRPLVLREIADALGLHESTISRVTTQKYMATPRGTFELKHFFGSHLATDTGGAASSTAIRALIRQIVAAENPKAPLSDSRISQILGEQGIVVARRTIAKYRDLLSIAPVGQRKCL
ncbi:MAG: RNA polymerase factor sigma-54 [Proteobacteria bacterium]|nr:RNA polymerase factor sigma-54 [Pseudomonadota bacterium]